MRDRLHGSAARRLAVGTPAHTVGDEKQPAAGIADEGTDVVGGETRLVNAQQLVKAGDQELVLILLAHLPAVGEAEDIDVGRDGPPLFDRYARITRAGFRLRIAHTGPRDVRNRENVARGADRPVGTALGLHSPAT